MKYVVQIDLISGVQLGFVRYVLLNEVTAVYSRIETVVATGIIQTSTQINPGLSKHDLYY